MLNMQDLVPGMCYVVRGHFKSNQLYKYKIRTSLIRQKDFFRDTLFTLSTLS